MGEEGSSLIIIMIGVFVLTLIIAYVVINFTHDTKVTEKTFNSSESVKEKQLDIFRKRVLSKQAVILPGSNTMFGVLNPKVGEVYVSRNELLGCYRVTITRLTKDEFKIILDYRKSLDSNDYILAYQTVITVPESTYHYSKDIVLNDILYSSVSGHETTISIDMLFMYSKYPNGDEKIIVQLIPISMG